MNDDIEKLSASERTNMNGILKLLQKLKRIKRERFDRILPMGEYFSDRWEKAKSLGFGAGASVYDSCYVYGDVSVGENSWIGPFTILDGSGGKLEIGHNTHVSAGVQIYTHDTVDIAICKGELRKGSVVIGNNSYIGPNAVISLGVKIGDHVVIGANSFVNSDIPSHNKAFGSPARIAADQETPK